MGRIESGLYPGDGAFWRRLEVLQALVVRHDVAWNEEWRQRNADRSPAFYSAEANDYFAKKEKGSIELGVTFVTGADPAKGPQKREYWLFGLRAMVKSQG